MSANCFWCKGEMFPVSVVGESHPSANTLDHVKCKAECATREEYNASQNKVRSCYRCNQIRNARYIRANPIPPKEGWWIKASKPRRTKAQIIPMPFHLQDERSRGTSYYHTYY